MQFLCTGNTQPPPSTIGDVRLVPYTNDGEGFYEVQIYYTDGREEASWGGICNDIHSTEEADVICQQLGLTLPSTDGNRFGGRYSINYSLLIGIGELCSKSVLLCYAGNASKILLVCS